MILMMLIRIPLVQLVTVFGTSLLIHKCVLQTTWGGEAIDSCGMLNEIEEEWNRR